MIPALRKWMALPLLLVVVVSWATPASAVTESRRKAEAEFLEGVASYKAKDYAKAIEHFEAALKLDRHPVLLFNLAVAADKKGDKAKAIEYYKEYLKTEPPDDVICRLRLQQLDPKALEALEAEIAAAKAGETGDEGAGKKEGEEPEVPELAKSQGSGEWGRGLAWGMIGLGTVAVAAGGVFGYMVIQDVEDFDSATIRSEAQDAKDAAEFHALLSNVGFGVGLTALTTGVVLYLVSDGSGAKAGSGGDTWSVSPYPGGAMITMGF